MLIVDNKVIADCTHGDGCPVHPDVHNLHNFDVLEVVHKNEAPQTRIADVLERNKFNPVDRFVIITAIEEMIVKAIHKHIMNDPHLYPDGSSA